MSAYCSGTFVAFYGEYLTSSVTLISPEPNFLQGPAYGTIDVPENPGRYAMLTGSIEVSGPNTPTIPFGSTGGFQFDNTVPLVGSFSVCLLPPGVFPNPANSPSCDPNYLDFATINVSIVGTDVFEFSFCEPQEEVCTYTETFTGAVPEPPSLGFVTLSGLMVAVIYRRRPRRHKRWTVEHSS